MIDLSDKTQQLVDIFFPDEIKEEAIHRVQYACAQNLPFREIDTPEGLERIRFAVLKISNGDIDDLTNAINLANTDWRDALVCAGFANDVGEHNKWADSVLQRV